MGNAETSRTVEPEVPVPFKEPQGPDRFWPEDPGDKFIPGIGGFIGDMVYYLRGTEVPTIFAVWASLFAISSVIRREAWLKWFPKPLFGNLYVVLVSPPAICRKSTVIDLVSDCLDNCSSGIRKEALRRIKRISVVKDKSTSEKLIDTMSKWSKRIVELPDQRKYYPGCPVAIIAEEMATFFGKQKYNEGLIASLMSIFNTKETHEMSTITRGTQKLSNLYTTLLCGTTQDGLKDSVPEAAMGDGFLSRSLVIYQNESTRVYNYAREVPGAPTMQDLANRLGWIAENTIGEHQLSAGAMELHKEWYARFKARTTTGDEWSKICSRMDNHILKVAFLLKAARYSLANEITEMDMKDSIRLVEYAMATAPHVLSELIGDEEKRLISRVSNYIRQKKVISRRLLMRNTGVLSSQLNSAIDFLMQSGQVDATLNGEHLPRSERDGDEVYTWLENT